MNIIREKKDLLKVFLVVILMILILSTIGLIGYAKKLTTNSKKCQKQEKIVKKTISIEQIKQQENILFLGDSITDFYPIDSIYLNLPIVKSGISGYTTQDILDRMDSMVYQYNPTKVFLLIGTNDIISDGEEKKDETIENIEKIIKKIKTKRKKAKIYLESIYPVNKRLDKDMVKDRENSIIQEINEELEKYCQKNNITYIDMYKELEDDDKNFSKEYTDDGLHPNDLGYAKISQVRIKYIYDIK